MARPEPVPLARFAPYQHFFEAHPIPTWVYDVETLGFLAVNDAAVAQYGYSREEFLAMSILDIRPVEDVAARVDRVAHLRGQIERSGVYHHRRKDGTIFEVETRSRALEWFGRTARMVIALDVSGRRSFEAAVRAVADAERERASAAILASERRFHVLIEHASDAIALFDDEGVLRYTSPSATRMLGCGASDVDVRRLNDFIHPEDTELVHAKFVTSLHAPGVPVPLTSRAVTPDGDLRLLEGQFTNLLQEPSIRAVVANLRDVTTERRLEEQFHQSQRLDSIGRLAGGIAHDFNNLLTVILGYAELLQQDAAEGHVDASALDEIRRAGERARDLTQHLLVFARRQVLTRRQVQLNEVIRRAERLLARLLGEDVAITTELAEDLWPVEADAAQLEQVLVNLSVNARDAMPEGGQLHIATYNQAALGETQGRPLEMVTLVVRDNGEGIPPAMLGRIFEPFFTTKPAGRGTGLGLPTVYSIVTQSGGTIDVESERGHGTTFTIRLPRALNVGPAQTLGPRVTPAQRGSEQVLVVEDDPGVRDLTVRSLQHAGYSVLVAAGGAEVPDLLAAVSSPLHLLVTDVVMPGRSGRQIAQDVIARHPAARVLYVSGYTQEVIDHHGVLDSNVELLRKPFTPSMLLSRVREVLDRKNAY